MRKNKAGFALRANGLLALSAAALLFGACSPPSSTELALPHAPAFDFDFTKLNLTEFMGKRAQLGSYTLIMTDVQKITLDEYIHIQGYMGRSKELPNFTKVPNSQNVLELNDDQKKDPENNPSMEANDFVVGINLGCGPETLKSMESTYPNLIFKNFVPGEKMSMKNTDVICLEGKMDLSKEEGLSAKVIEFHDLELTLQDNEVKAFPIKAHTYVIDGDNSVVLPNSFRPENDKVALNKTSNRALFLWFRNLTGGGLLNIDSYGEDEVGFQAK